MMNTLANQAIPPVSAAKPANAYAMTGMSPASIVPSLRQTVMGIEAPSALPVSYTHLTLPTIYSV